MSNKFNSRKSFLNRAKRPRLFDEALHYVSFSPFAVDKKPFYLLISFQQDKQGVQKDPSDGRYFPQ